MHYYEVYNVTHSGDTDADGIDYKGSCEAVAFDTLEEATEYADKNGNNFIAEIGGAWDEFEKCAFCGEWFTSAELNIYGDCERCEQAMKDHGGYRPPENN